MANDTFLKKHGLVRAGDPVDRKTDLAVYLDGEEVTRQCQVADDVLGFVVLYIGSIREIRFGDVKIFACERDAE